MTTDTDGTEDTTTTILPSPAGTLLYILWDRKHGELLSLDEDGASGRITAANAHLTRYARYPKGKSSKDLATLDIGACIEGVQIALPGNTVTYDVYRVR